MERLPRQKPFRLASPQMLEDLHAIGGVQLMEALSSVLRATVQFPTETGFRESKPVPAGNGTPGRCTLSPLPAG